MIPVCILAASAPGYAQEQPEKLPGNTALPSSKEAW